MRGELTVAKQFVEDHPDEAAAVLEQSTFTDAAAFLGELEPALAARTLARISASLAVDCLRSMPDAQVGTLLEALPLDLATRLLRRAPDDTRSVWLAALSESRAEALRRKLRYPQGTAGALADPLVLALPEDLSVAEAQKQLRRSPDRAYYYVFVVDREQHLVGALDIRELMLAQTKDTLSDVMHRDLLRLAAHSDLAAILTHPGWRDLDALPVVDANGVFFGIVRHRTIRQIAGPGASRPPLEPAVSTLVSLGELYWTGLSAFLAGVSARPALPGAGRGGR